MYVFIGITSIYAAYMITQDVPMYIQRWKTLEKNFNSFSKGIEDMRTCQVQTTSETVWKDDSLWRIGYFSGGVWCSMALVLWLNKYEKMMNGKNKTFSIKKRQMIAKQVLTKTNANLI